MSHMTIPEIEAKIAQIDGWLINNPANLDASTVLRDKAVLEVQLGAAKLNETEVNNPEIVK